MQPYSFAEDTFTNFGDDLNQWLWTSLLPEENWQQDGTLFCGIGTVLGTGLPSADRYIVFSSGVGYGPPPKGFGGTNWNVVCVRGPLTAKVLGLSPAKAICDGAILLSHLPEGQPLPESERSGIVFMPHYDILDAADWQEICDRAGVELLSPLLPSKEVVQRLRRSKLVLADAMHAAIVADTLRVPWVPLTTSNRINAFKWLDWTLTLGLPYEPTRLPSPSTLEHVRNNTLALHDQDYFLEQRTQEAALLDFERRKRRRSHSLWPSYARLARKMTYFAPRRVLGHPWLSPRVQRDTAQRLDQCAAALRKAMDLPSYLSEDRRFYSNVHALLDKLEEVKSLQHSPLATQ